MSRTDTDEVTHLRALLAKQTVRADGLDQQLSAVLAGIKRNTKIMNGDNHLIAAAKALEARAEKAEAVLGIIESWTHTYGAALKPPRADTYGEGMCDAKDQVRRIIRSMS